jgi:O-antigen ligase
MSRTVTVSVIILFLAVNGYLAITKKGLLYMFGFFVTVSLFYVYLFSTDLQRGAAGLEGFLYKLKIAPAEIFASKINVKDHSDLWDHWRAYEAQKAFEQINDTPFAIGLLIGKGVGSLVDLEFVVPLDKEGIQYITTLHNGYSYIAFKSGFLGLVAFLLFLLILYMRVYIKNYNLKAIITNNLLSGIAIYYMFTTLIVSGIYNPRDFVGIIVGGLLFLNYHYKSDKNLIKTGFKELS